MPPFSGLKAFDALVRFGGIRRAAQYLEVHHSVVSRHVIKLEAWLGVSLVQWSHKQFTLTTEGQEYHARISAAISQIEAATRSIIEGELGRPLRIWCSPGLSTQWLAGQIADFERLNPQLPVELKPSDEPANLQTHEADVNIYLRLDDADPKALRPGLKTQSLFRPETMLAASPDLGARLAGIACPQDVARFPLLHGKQRNEWRLWFCQQGLDLPDNTPGELCWNPHMALEAARLGRGILLANRFFFARDLARGDLIEVAVPGAVSSSVGEYVFEAREDRWNAPATARIRKFIADRFRESGVAPFRKVSA